MINIHRYKHDWIFALGILVIIGSIYGFIIYEQILRYKEHTLIFELRALRNAVVTFHYVHGRNPENLNELRDASYKTEKGMTKFYVPRSMLNKKGKLIDPFGTEYDYDKAVGWVRTSNESYGGW